MTQQRDRKDFPKMKASEFIQKLKDVEANHKTLYVMGCFGAPLTGGNVSRYCSNHTYNKAAARTKMIKAAANQTPPVFGFDCVNLIKGILWGWTGDPARTYGGAAHASNGVPDVGADGMIKLCKDVSTTGWASMLPGEAVWMSGHIGVYIGGGLAIECSPKWANRVQITAVGNIGSKAGYNTRKWAKHGKLPYITYDLQADQAPATTPPAAPAPSTGSTEAPKQVKAKEAARSLNKALTGTYTVTAGDGLHIRDGAGTNKGSLAVLPYGTKVRNYGYYTQAGDTKWLYIQVTLGGTTYTGFSSAKYLAKK